MVVDRRESTAASAYVQCLQAAMSWYAASSPVTCLLVRKWQSCQLSPRGLMEHLPVHVHSRAASTAQTAATTVAKDGILAPACVWPAIVEWGCTGS